MYPEPLLLILLLCCFDKGSGIFLRQPGSVYAVLGYPENIPCITSVEPLLYHWQSLDSTGNPVIIVDSGGVVPGLTEKYSFTKSGTNLTLKIKSVSLTEPQVWCQVFVLSDTGPQQHASSKSNLTITARPYSAPTCSMSARSVSIGDIVTLTCNSAGGLPAASLGWEYTKGTILNNGPGGKGSESNGRENRVLAHTFKVKKEDDKKKFTCTAENPAITVLHERGELPADKLSCSTESLNVNYKPYQVAVEPAGSYTVAEGDSTNLTLACSVGDSNPQAVQFGFKVNNENWSLWNSANTHTYAGLTRFNAGDYTCRARNSIGTTSSPSATLIVHYPPQGLELLASNTDVGVVYSIKEGDDLVLECKAHGGYPAKYSYMWTRDRDDADVKYTYQLRVDTIQRTRAGTYRCTATITMKPTNKVEQVGTVTKAVEIDVQYPPEVKSTVPNTLQQAAVIGQEVSIFVQVLANPLPTLKWKRLVGSYPADLPSSGFEVQNTNLSSKLILYSITREMFGEYVLTVTNEVGYADVTFEISQQVIPHRPLNLRVSSTAVSITVDWDRGWDGGLVQVFRLRYSEDTKIIPDSTPHYKVKLNAADGIIESTDYTIVLSAENSKGSSLSSTMKVKTKDKPAVDIGGTSIELDEDNSIVRIRWSVYHSDSFDSIRTQICEFDSQECTEHNVTNTYDASRLVTPTGTKFKVSFFMYDVGDLVSSQENVITIEDSRSQQNNTVIIIVVVVVILLLFGCGVILGCFIWRRSRKKPGSNRTGVEMNERVNRGFSDRSRTHESRDSPALSFGDDGGTEYEQTHPEYVNQHLEKPQYAALKPLDNPEKQEVVYEEVRPKGRECSLNDVKQESMVYTCDLYEVYRATARKLEGIKSGTMVLVKRSKGGTPHFVQSILLNEIKALRAVGGHPNVVIIIAQCTFSDPVLVVFKMEHHGRLDVYLDGPGNDISQGVLKTMSTDVVTGMAYLAELKPDILHYCLAAKHIMVSDTVTCKVSGFGFADHVLEKEEYERVTGLEQDVRWMAPEQLRHNIHSKKSDIWAYGVLMWEIYSYGQTPYPDMPSDEVKQHVLSGNVLGRPTTLPVGMYQTMLECLRNEEQERPNFQQLLRTLEHME